MQPSSGSISFIHDEPFVVGMVALIPIIGYLVLNWIGLAGGEFREPVWLITLVCLYWISMRAWEIPSSEVSGTSWGSIALAGGLSMLGAWGVVKIARWAMYQVTG